MSFPSSAPSGALKRALQLLWSAADGFAKKRLLLASTLVLCAAALTGLLPVLLKHLVEKLSGGESYEPWTEPAVALLAAYALAHYLAKLLNELRMLPYAGAEQRLYRRISLHMLDHVLHLPLRVHLEHRSGAIGQTLTNGLLGYQIVLNHLVYTAMPVAVEMLTVAAVLIHFDHPEYLSILTATGILYAITFAHGAARIVAPARAVAAARIGAFGVLTDGLINCEVVKTFNVELPVRDRFDQALRSTELHWRTLFSRRTLTGILVASIFAGSLTTSLWLAAREVAAGSMTLGDFILVNAYIIQIVRPFELLGYAVRDIAQGIAFVERMLQLLSEKAESRATTAHAASGGDIVFEGITFAYRPGSPVLQDLNLRIASGETVGIVGDSGSGKSSLIRLLLRMYEPQAGRILLDGVPVQDLPHAALRRAIAVVPQDSVLFDDTVEYNISLGRPGIDREAVECAARLARVHEFIVTLPDGYETLVGERGLKLSGGQRQRIAIARALACSPAIIAFDEATSSLDSMSEELVVQNLRELPSGTTKLVIAHRLSTVVDADRIVVLRHGAVAEQGTHSELLGSDGWYALMWRTQQHTAACRRPSTMSAARS